MSRINKVIDLLEQKQPVYYTSTELLTYENGVKMAQTWADYVRLDLEHGPFDMGGLDAFMHGLVAGGPTKSGHRTPAVVAELPIDGIDESVVCSNSWMIKQLLARGVHGLILCHADTLGAVRAFVESARYSFKKSGVGDKLGPGRRGHGGQKSAAEIWGISVDEYLEKADVWPLNPRGELILGIKIENKRALANSEASTRVPGIAFGEWGPGDMSMSFGYSKIPFPLSPELETVQQRVWNACKNAGICFLDIVTPETIYSMIDRGLMFCRAHEPETAEMGRRYTKRTMPW